MDHSEKIKELRESTGMNRREFCDYFHIPYRTVTEWERDNRHAPEYVLRLLEYLLFFKLFTASCCTLFTTIFKIILNATSHYSSPIMHIKYCYPKRSTLF